jgi:multicomponent Na+:H+ antiporter subunit D
LIAFGIKCAFPFLHNWLQDAYPEATVVGTVVLSAFTTKLAIYALARGFPGTEILIYIGVIMTAFPVFFAVIENDLRRVLAFSLNNQLGFMVAGIGVGTPIALNGAISHAFVHVIYKSLLFMSMGAVLHRVGTIKASELGGLFKSMPLTAVFCMVGAASISAFPLFSGFVTKSLTLTGVAEAGYVISWLVLVFASAGVLEHSGIKIPYFAFFAHDSGLRCREAPANMLIAMGLAAVLCIFFGVYPEPLYAMLPYEVDYEPYTTSHVLSQLQLLFFAMLAFAVLIRTGLYPAERPSTNLNTDWIYRKALPVLVRWAMTVGAAVRDGLLARGRRRLERALAQIARHHGPEGILARTVPTGSTIVWVAVLLAVMLLLNYV